MKTLLDNYIQHNYKEVNRYANYFLHRLKSKLDVDTVINNAYLRTIQYKHPIEFEYEAKALLFESIKAEVLWNSESKKELINSVESDYILKYQISQSYLMNLLIPGQSKVSMKKV